MAGESQFPEEQDPDGSFKRQQDAFDDWVRADGSTAFAPELGRYHLYVSLACPWAHRIIVVRRLKRLEDVVGMTVVDPIRNDADGWAFRAGNGHSEDPINGFKLLKEAYLATDSGYKGRVTVPVLWDKRTQRIVSNNDDDLMRMLNREFDEFTDSRLNLVPDDKREEIDRLNEQIYENVNNGVYRAGFATSQSAYEDAVRPLFAALDELEERLNDSCFLFGDEPLETDWRLFVTLIRFDAVYVGHFKCNLRRIADYPNLHRYLKDLCRIPGIADTINIDHIKRHYYVTHDDINPTGIVPFGPQLDLGLD